MQFLRLQNRQNWFHVKSKWQKNPEFSTLCIPNRAAQVCNCLENSHFQFSDWNLLYFFEIRLPHNLWCDVYVYLSVQCLLRSQMIFLSNAYKYWQTMLSTTSQKLSPQTNLINARIFFFPKDFIFFVNYSIVQRLFISRLLVCRKV